MLAKDFSGNVIQIGDEVIFKPSKRHQTVGLVTHIMPKMLTVLTEEPSVQFRVLHRNVSIKKRLYRE